ncbi:MAG: MoxR family ATPase [Candidatus Babeliales bacterium]
MIEPVPYDVIIEKIKIHTHQIHALRTEIKKVIVGQEDIIDFIIIALVCNGHILLEGVPGIAKTTLVKTFSQALGLTCRRIQFTPDLLPSDLIGTLIFNQKIQEFETKKGPIFSNLILADEVNRAPAKVQAALLEAMQERQVTIGNQTFILEDPFLVFATQNPIDQEGTYQLPEAQLDRFMLCLLVDYPSLHEEREIIYRSSLKITVQSVLSKTDVLDIQMLIKETFIDEKIVDYIVNIIFAARKPSAYQLKNIEALIARGPSPRASLALYIAAKAYAVIQGRSFVTPEDVKIVAFPVLRHRLILSYEAEATNIKSDEIIKKIIDHMPTP